MNRVFSLFILSILCLHCPHQPIKATTAPSGPALTLFEWNQTEKEGRIKANSTAGKEELAEPILTHPGSLFVSYGYVAGTSLESDLIQGSLQPIVIYSATQPPHIERETNGSIKEAWISVKQVCNQAGYQGLVATPVSRLVHPDVRIPPCFVRVEDYSNEQVTLHMDSQEAHLGDTYLILLSPFDSNPWTQKKTISCTITETLQNNPKSNWPRCKLDTKNRIFQDEGGLYRNHYALLWKTGSQPEALPPPPVVSEKSPEPPKVIPLPSVKEPTFFLVETVERKKGKIRRNLKIENMHAPSEPHQIFAIYPAESASEEHSSSKPDQGLHQTISPPPLGYLRLPASQIPTVCWNQGQQISTPSKNRYSVQILSLEEAAHQEGHCFSQVAVPSSKTAKAKMTTIPFRKGFQNHIQTGENYRLFSTQEDIPFSPLSSCIIKKKGSTSESARCVLSKKLPSTENVQSLYAVHSSLFPSKKEKP